MSRLWLPAEWLERDEAELGMNRFRREMAREGVEEALPRALPELKGDSWGDSCVGDSCSACSGFIFGRFFISF